MSVYKKISCEVFPNSKKDPFEITSPQTLYYNCIAWAYGDDTKWYWPCPSNFYYWPKNIPRIENVDSFIKLFNSIRYEVCNDGKLKTEFEKVAIFANSSGIPTHAAKQLNNGFWSSKLGNSYDVQHSIKSIEGGCYGMVKVYMKRLIKNN